MSVYRDIYRRIRASQAEAGIGGSLARAARLIKVQEEAGEVAQAYIGFIGANKRKGYTHAEADIANELADVVITAMVALHDWTPSPESLVKEHLQGLLKRIQEEGS